MATASPAPPAAAPTQTLSRAQLRDALWLDSRHTVYAVVMGHRVAGLQAKLAAADVDDWDILWMGELDDSEDAAAPALVTLRRDSPFTAWLLDEADADLGPWGVLLLSTQRFIPLRTKGRELCRAQLPNGQAIRLDWMDPEILQALLPVAPADQLQRVFYGFDAIVCTGTRAWTRYSVSAGRLVQQNFSVA